MNGSFMSSRAGQLANVTRDHLTQFTSDPRAATCAPAGLVSASARLCSANSTWQREVSCCRRQVAHPHLDIIRRLPHPPVETVINLLIYDTAISALVRHVAWNERRVSPTETLKPSYEVLTVLSGTVMCEENC